jgi:hypothetical protein
MFGKRFSHRGNEENGGGLSRVALRQEVLEQTGALFYIEITNERKGVLNFCLVLI